MNEVLVRFFNKINFLYEESEFKNVSVDKVVVNKKAKTWDVFLVALKPIDIDVLKKLKEHSKNGVDDIKEINIYVSIKEVSLNDVLNAFNYFVKELAINNPSMSSLLDNEIKISDEVICVEVINKAERMVLLDKEKQIIKNLKDYGYGDFKLDTVINEEKHNQVKEEIKENKVDIIKEDAPKYKVVVGESIKSKPLKINEIIGEDNNVTV